MELGAGEIIVILAIVLLLFGPSKLPKLGEGLGSAIGNFRKAMRGDEPQAKASGERTAPPALPQPAPREEPRASAANGVQSGARS
jgi:sec-independent protein translocase protein TatA